MEMIAMQQFKVPVSMDQIFQHTTGTYTRKETTDQLERALSTEFVNCQLEKGLMYGEIHPEFRDFVDVLSVNLNYAAFRVISLTRAAEDQYHAVIEPVSTKCGLGLFQSIALDYPVLQFIPRVLFNEQKELIQFITLDAGVCETEQAIQTYRSIEQSLMEERPWVQS